MPDAEIWEDFRIGDIQRWTFRTFGRWEDVFVRQHQQEVAQVIRRSPKPILKTEHEAAGILRLLHGQVLENRRQRVQQFEHGVLEASASGFLPLLHEAGDRALALTQLGH